MDINQTDRTDNLVLALAAAIKASKIPFHVYDASFFSGEGMLEGDILVIAETHESEYAIVIETVNDMKTVPTVAGMRDVKSQVHKIYYPDYDMGDKSVGLEDAWIIDFDEAHPDYATEGMVDACIHIVNWFMNREIIDNINNALSADEFEANHFINPEE